MIGLSRSVRVWAHAQPTDLRKGDNGLYALVEQQLQCDPLSGDMFLFVNRTRTSCKVLLWDGTGLCIFSKRWSAVVLLDCGARPIRQQSFSQRVNYSSSLKAACY